MKVKLKDFIKSNLLLIYKSLESEDIPVYEREFLQGQLMILKEIEAICEHRKRY